MSRATPYYAYARSIDAQTGDLLMDGPNWRPGSPMAESVSFLVRSARSPSAADPDAGPDYEAVQKGAPNAAARWRAELEAALRPLTGPGLITELRVTVDRVGARLDATITFRDPQLDGPPLTVRHRAE